MNLILVFINVDGFVRRNTQVTIKPLEKVKIVMLSMIVIMGLRTLAQNRGSSADPSLDAYIDALRADMRSDKIEVIKEAMQFSEKDAAAFWPIYKKYEAEQGKLNDERIQLIKRYSDKWSTLTDAEARTVALGALDLDSRQADLKKKYFAEFDRVLPGLVVAKFFQLEYRLDLLVDLEIASELPALLTRPPGMPNETIQVKPN